MTEPVGVTLTVQVDEERVERVFDVVTLAELETDDDAVVDGEGEYVGVTVADEDEDDDLE